MSCLIDEDDVWRVPRGQALDLLYIARVADGSALELENITVTIVNASPAALGAVATVTVLNAEHGYIGITVPEAAVAQHLRTGRTTFFWLRFAWPDWTGQPPIRTGKLWIQIDG